jgi:hypothetical protein
LSRAASSPASGKATRSPSESPQRSSLTRKPPSLKARPSTRARRCAGCRPWRLLISYRLEIGRRTLFRSSRLVKSVLRTIAPRPG